METPEDKWVELTNRDGPLTETELEAIYDTLKPVTADDLIGEWKGGSFDTGHPVHTKLQTMNWLGKTFHSTEEVYPIMVEIEGQRVCDENWGHARLRRVEFRGILSTAMIYDNFPIIDHFRRVNDNMLAGAMDTKMFGDSGTYYFYLYK